MLDLVQYSSHRDRLFAVQQALSRNRGIRLVFAKSAASADAAQTRGSLEAKALPHG
jgi:hypothetical protein